MLTATKSATDGGSATAAVTYAYDAYAAFGTFTAGSPTDRFGFAGAEWDGVTTLYAAGRGRRDETAGRFLEPDPLGLAPDSNPYRPVHNSPTNLTDPSGLQPPG